MTTMRSVLAVLLALAPWGEALGHPHGTMQCSLAVGFEAGRPVLLSGRLLMDAAHSKEMQAMLRDPATGQLDAQRQQRFMFSLKMQLARSNWLLGAEANGMVAGLSPAREPVLVLGDDGRVGVDVALRIEPATGDQAEAGADLSADPAASRPSALRVSLPPDATWQFFCADPTYYWVTEFAEPSAPVAVTGCMAPVQATALAVATGARAGSVQVALRCTG